MVSDGNVDGIIIVMQGNLFIAIINFKFFQKDNSTLRTSRTNILNNCFKNMKKFYRVIEIAIFNK
jgi:hypothetical protein